VKCRKQAITAMRAAMLKTTAVFEFIKICYDYLIINMGRIPFVSITWYSSSSLYKTYFRYSVWESWLNNIFANIFLR